MKVRLQIPTGKKADGATQLKNTLWQGGLAYYGIMKHHRVSKTMDDISRKEENDRREVRQKYGKKMTLENKGKKSQETQIQNPQNFQQRRKREIKSSQSF